MLDSDFLKFKREFKDKCSRRIDRIFEGQIQRLKDSVVAKEQEIKREKQLREEAEKKVLKLERKVQRREEEIKREVGLKEEMEKDFDQVKEEIGRLNLDIFIDLKTEEGKTTRDRWSKVGFPHLRRLRIDNVKKDDQALKSFFLNSCPPSLLYFNFNDEYLGKGEADGIRISYYFQSMKELLQRTTKEIFFKHLFVSSQDLCNIFKASSQCERLTLKWCKIDTSGDLDFSIPHPLSYKISYLSFRNCGYRDWCKMHWDKYPERFEKILEAIKNSSLKNSLKTINMERCEIKEDQIKDLLRAHRLSRIAIVFEKNNPIESE